MSPSAGHASFVTVANYSTSIEAEIARGVLEAEGINSRVPDSMTVGIGPHLAHVVGGVRLMVASNDLDRAQSVLQQHFEEGEERQVYRMSRSHAFEGAIAGGLIGSVLGAVVTAGPAIAVFSLAGLLVGAVFGVRRQSVYCSNLSCRFDIPESAAACPGCGFAVGTD